MCSFGMSLAGNNILIFLSEERLAELNLPDATQRNSRNKIGYFFEAAEGVVIK